MFCQWPALSPNLTHCDYFLWGYMKDTVFVPPQPISIPDLKNRITAAVETITPDLLIIGLSPQCVPCDEGCIHQTFVGVYHKLVELLFSFLLVFISLFTIPVNIINFQTAPIILIHAVFRKGI